MTKKSPNKFPVTADEVNAYVEQEVAAALKAERSKVATKAKPSTLKELRIHAGLNQARLAEVMKITQASVSRVELGDFRTTDVALKSASRLIFHNLPDKAQAVTSIPKIRDALILDHGSGDITPEDFAAPGYTRDALGRATKIEK